jgi:hypothetical protein
VAQDAATEQDSNHVVDPKDIIADPKLQKPIEEKHPNIQDDAKKEYVLLGPCQPKGRNHLIRKIYGNNWRFLDKWFTNWKDGPKLFDDHVNTKNGMSHSH